MKDRVLVPLVCSTTSPLAINDPDRAAGDLRTLATLAAPLGIRICYEALSWGRHVNRWHQAWDIVRRCDHAGVGLNLHAASNVVLAELSWTAAEQEQAIDRVHRIGQEEPVTAWRILAAHTIDSKIAELIDSKQGLAARALDGSDVEVGSGDSVQLDALLHLLREALGA